MIIGARIGLVADPVFVHSMLSINLIKNQSPWMGISQVERAFWEFKNLINTGRLAKVSSWCILCPISKDF